MKVPHTGSDRHRNWMKNSFMRMQLEGCEVSQVRDD